MAEGRVPSSVSVTVAHKLLLAGHRYLDVRTSEEFRQGHACGAINVPYMLRGTSGMSKNTEFLEQVSSHFGQSDEIIVGCQSGGRSSKATTDLLDAGFTGVKDITGGYAAWTHHGLPTQDWTDDSPSHHHLSHIMFFYLSLLLFSFGTAYLL